MRSTVTRILASDLVGKYTKALSIQLFLWEPPLGMQFSLRVAWQAGNDLFGQSSGV